MKFKINDPVWAQSNGTNFPPGEMAATILAVVTDKTDKAYGGDYRIDLQLHPLPRNGKGWLVFERRLRPRRDDYQQHEPLGSMLNIDKPLELNEDNLEFIFTSSDTAPEEV